MQVSLPSVLPISARVDAHQARAVLDIWPLCQAWGRCKGTLGCCFPLKITLQFPSVSAG